MDIVDEMGDIPEPNDDKFYRMEDFVGPYSFDSESDLLPVANDNEPKQPDPAEPEPVSDSESSISFLNSAYSLDPTLLTPTERTLQIRAAHSRELM